MILFNRDLICKIGEKTAVHCDAVNTDEHAADTDQLIFLRWHRIKTFLLSYMYEECINSLKWELKWDQSKKATHLVEVPLQEELLEDTDELLQRRKLPPVQLHQLHWLQPVGHVEADVHLDLCTLVRQLDYWHRCLVQHLKKAQVKEGKAAWTRHFHLKTKWF